MITLKRYFTRDYTWQHFSILFLCAFLVRALTFGLYVQHEERYKQADSSDYHFCALCLKTGTGMTRPDTLQPIFWRTPGYPLFLSYFYRHYPTNTYDFIQNNQAQKASIWIQILLCSFLPLLIFFLAHALTHSFLIAWLCAWISVFHIGFILASCYILSDALANLFFTGFLLFFYQSFLLWFEPGSTKARSIFFNVGMAALLLGIYTWMRPNGQFIVVIGALILLAGHCAWRIKLSKIALFALIFFATIGGWYIRNYQLTGHWFFCPMSGPYLQSFSAPKIVRRVAQQPLEACMKYLMLQVITQTNQEAARLAKEAPHLKVCRELICSDVARPWILEHPWYFLADWIKESLKTTFDLYSSQLVAMANKTHSYDPLEEFLSEKIMLCLFNQKISLFMGFICWLELIFALLLWIGLIGGFWIFLIKPYITKETSHKALFNQALWLKTGFLIGSMIVMTGGFGYARLRMPIEPLLIMLSLTFWYHQILHTYTTKNSARKRS